MAVNINVPSQVKTYANLAAFPATGALKTIYIAEDTNKTYRWTGSVYTEISASAAMTWGAIGGTLSNQTDLQNALDAKQDDITLTTTGSSGASTLVGSTLNVPNYTLSGLGGVPTSRTLTINGVTQDLSANRTFTISTGITIGSTAIASGTVGRILFEGAGNVVQESSSLTWDNAANRFQVGTGVNILATNTFPTNANSPYVVLGPYNANFGGDQGALFNLTNNNTSGNSAAIFRFGMTSPATGAIGEFGATSSTFSGFTSLVFFNSKGAFPLAFLTNDTERLRIHGTTGNVLINTTTDAGFRLDVNGTARVVATHQIYRNNQVGAIDLNLYNGQSGWQGGMYYNTGAGGSGQRLTFYAGGALGSADRMSIFSSGNIGINTTTDAGFRLDVNGTARVNNIFYITNPSYTGNIRIESIGNNQQRIVGAYGENITWGPNNAIVINSGETYVSGSFLGSGWWMQSNGATVLGAQAAAAASALLDIRSTTRGFLPPRMTTTQKNAIASPAAGLMVYDTTLNVISYYNGSMWI